MIVELTSKSARVHHLTLGVARMHADALDSDACSGCVEVFVFEIAEPAAVHRLGKVRA